MPWSKNPHLYTWKDLEGHVTPQVLCAPRTAGDLTNEWQAVHSRVISYLVRNVAGKPWMDHLVLIAAVMSSQLRDVWTVENVMRTLNPRFSQLFSHFELGDVRHWSIERHLIPYLRGAALTEDSPTVRMMLFKRYMSSTNLVASWFDLLPVDQQVVYQPFLLPTLNSFVAKEFSKMEKDLEQQQKELRKQETEAVVPEFSMLRAEAHFRYNRITRLWQAYQQALNQVLPDHSNLPLDFNYEEGDPPVERIVCRLWDRRSFVLDPEHIYHENTVYHAKKKQRGFTDKRNHVFLEFIRADRLYQDAPPEGFWFYDILKLGLLGYKARYGSPQEVEEKQRWLRQWGYGDDNSKENTSPFESHQQGLLNSSTSNPDIDARNIFLTEAQKRTDGLIIPIESLFPATTFGLLALELLTTTGMRINELMQVSLLHECIVRIVDDPPPGATDQTPRIRYILRLLPKGERTDKRHHYGIGTDALQLMKKTAQMLCDHYHLQPGEPLPRVPFSSDSSRRHRFGEEKTPYIFQYNNQHLADGTISACIRFLMHGMTFQTSLGEPVILKPHLLRHAFSTFAVQVEGLPIDLVAEWLKQKNLDTTRYYSEKGQQEVAEEHSSFIERLAIEINVREAIVRSPEEIRKLAEAARRSVGTLVPICGGKCAFDGWCHNQFDCIRCPSKIPEPEKRYQVEEKQHWAEERLAYYEHEGLVLEAEKMRQLLRNCALELREMDMMEAYRKDEKHVAHIEFYPRSPRNSKE